MKPKRSREEIRRTKAFAEGMCAALATVAAHDQETIWREIVASGGGYDYLYGVSKRAGCLRIDGFSQYRRQP